MNILCAGLNHNIAPVEVRERLAFDRVACEDALDQAGDGKHAVLAVGLNDDLVQLDVGGLEASRAPRDG